MKKHIRALVVLLLVLSLFTAMGVTSVFATETESVSTAETLAEATTETVVETVVDLETEWKYLDDDTDPAEGLSSLQAWTLPSFDDSAWQSGLGAFGTKNGVTTGMTSYGAGNPVTPLNLYSESNTAEVITTYYFRTTFEIDNAESVTALDFDISADDAPIVYINGKMVFDGRTSIPDSAATTNKYYASASMINRAVSLTAEQLSGVLVDGVNRLAVEVHNNQKGSSDVYFAIKTMTVTFTEEIDLTGTYSDILDSSAVWKYLDDDTDPAEGLSSLQAWTLPSFDDSAWKSAAGSFGSKGGAIGTVSGCGTPATLINLYQTGATTVIPTYYFRTTFEVESAAKVLSLEFSLHSDDAIIIYLNGSVIYDGVTSITSGDPTTSNKYYASGNIGAQTFSVDKEALAGALLDGENLLAVELHNNQSGSSDIFFGVDSFGAMVLADWVSPTFEQIVLGVGANETQRGLAWYSVSSRSAVVQYAPVGADREVFPTEFKTAEAVTSVATNKPGYYTNKATLTGLVENTEYVYRILSDGVYSPLKYFSTTGTDEFEFVFVGDPQFDIAKWSKEWRDTLQKIDKYFNAELVVSAGDQINTPSSEDAYTQFIVSELASVAFAPSVGPGHDDPSIAYSEHFYTPNLSDKYGVTVSSANYWYRYGNTLFMHLNMADTTALEEEHKLFIEETMAQNTDAVWNIVVLHKALFATGAHGDPNGSYFETEMSVIRPVLAQQLSDLGIDIALGGHDHVYVRSHLMNGVEVSEDEVFDNKVVNPTGTLHISASSSTGSKFHTSYSYYEYFAAYQNDEKRKSAIRFVIDDDSIVMESYFLDTMTVFDSFTIEKKLKADGSVPSKAKINWLDAEGNLIATTRGYESFVADIPENAVVPAGDGWRDIRITKWLDESGNESDLIIGTDSEYTFIAAEVQPSDGGYTASITEAMLNLTYYSQFHMNLYLPVTAGMTRPTVAGASASNGKVYIRDREYWVYTWWLSATTVTDDKEVSVVFTIDGVEYTQKFIIGGMVYAEIAMPDAASDAERIAIANMLRYVREAQVYAGQNASDRFDALIGTYDGSVAGMVTLPDYPAKYLPLDTDLGRLEDYLSQVYLRLSGSPNFVFVLNDAGKNAGLTHNSFTVYSESGTRIYLFDYAKDGITYQTNNLKVYNAIEKLHITLTVPATEEGGEPTVITGTYSLATYITAVEGTGANVDVAKALYAFGEAAKKYRDTLK